MTDVETLAGELTDRLINRGRVPQRLRGTTQRFMQLELVRTLRRITRTTSSNAGMLLAYRRQFACGPSGG